MTSRSAALGPSQAPLWLIGAALVLGALLRLPLAGPERAVEGALVVAGIVRYPPSALMAHYYLGSFTSLHQVGALLLRAGLPESVLELLYCVVPSGLVLAAFALWIYGFCRRPVFALAAATLCFLSGLLVDRFASPDYPLMGVTWDRAASHTYGIWAGAGSAFAFGALAGGRNVLAGAAAALLVAVHPVIGAFTAAVVAAAWLAGRFVWRDLPVAGIGRGLALGGGAALASLAVFLAMRPAAGAVDRAAFETYSAVWEFHRNVGMAPAAQVLVPLVLLALVPLAVFRFRGAAKGGAEVARGGAEVAALALLGALVASGALYFAVHLAPAGLPALIERAMPGRLLNVHAALAGVVVVGGAAWAVERTLVPRWPRPGWLYLALAVGLAFAAGVWGPLRSFGAAAQRLAEHRLSNLFEPDPFWSAVREAGAGRVVLTSFGATHAALVAGHLAPALDPTGFDFVPYLPHTAAEVQRLVERGYGVSFASPPAELLRRGALEGDPQRGYWEGLGREAWSGLGAELGVAGVVAPSDWRLQLAPGVRGAHFSYYPIPPVP
jgi:hypothetical protein